MLCDVLRLKECLNKYIVKSKREVSGIKKAGCWKAVSEIGWTVLEISKLWQFDWEIPDKLLFKTFVWGIPNSAWIKFRTLQGESNSNNTSPKMDKIELTFFILQISFTFANIDAIFPIKCYFFLNKS